MNLVNDSDEINTDDALSRWQRPRHMPRIAKKTPQRTSKKKPPPTPAEIARGKAIAGRLQWIVDTHGGGSARGLAETCKFKSLSHISDILRDLPFGLRLATTNAIWDQVCQPFSLRREWLLEGIEPRYAGTAVELDERYPERATAIRHAREQGYSEAAIDYVKSLDLKSDDDPGVKYWFGRIVSRENDLNDPFAPKLRGREASDDE